MVAKLISNINNGVEIGSVGRNAICEHQRKNSNHIWHLLTVNLYI